jgi:hypothetical protein
MGLGMKDFEWIPVAERLPSDGQLCAVIAPGAVEGDLWPSRWSARYQNFEAGFGWFELDEVTHWTPLPELPTAGKQGDSCQPEREGRITKRLSADQRGESR